MILINRVARYFTRFVKPAFHNIVNPKQLFYNPEFVTKAIQNQNQFLKHPQKFLNGAPLINHFGIDRSKINNQLTLDIHAYTANFKKQQINQNIYTGEFESKIILEELGYGIEPEDLTMHFSFMKGHLQLKQYNLSQNEILLFNLHPKTEEKDIEKLFKNEKISSIVLHECMIGFVAYAKVTFQNQQSVQNVLKLNDYEDIKLHNREIDIKTQKNLEFIQTKNRHLYINNIPKTMTPNELLFYLSKFGRVVHFEFPHRIHLKPSVYDIKRQSKKYPNHLFKVINHFQDGTTRTQYYPEYTRKNQQITHDSQQKIAQIIQKYHAYQKTVYEQRLKYALQIDCYPQSEQKQIQIHNRGYCSVIYSSTEQAQNCYFQLQDIYGVYLANKYEFQFDIQHKKALLRQIDNRVSQNKVNKYYLNLIKNKNRMKRPRRLSKRHHQKRKNPRKLIPINKLYSRMKNRQLQRIRQKLKKIQPRVKFNRINLRKRKMDQLNQMNDRYREQFKTNSVTNQATKPFNQLAEIQLFGRVLTKQQKKPASRIYKPASSYDNINFNIISRYKNDRKLLYHRDSQFKSISRRRYKKQLKYAARQIRKEKQIRRKKLAQETTNQPAAQFSTMKAENIYRSLTIEERANRSVAYNKMLKLLINQYFGIFSQEKLNDKRKTYQISSFNKLQQQFDNHKPYVTQEDLPTIFKFHTNQDQAYQNFVNFYRKQQAFKSLPIGARQKIEQNIKANLKDVNLLLEDTGLIQKIFEVDENEDANQLVQKINRFEAEHGEHYTTEIIQGKIYIVKFKRTQPLFPLEYSVKIDEILQKYIKQNPKKAKRLQKQVQKQFQGQNKGRMYSRRKINKQAYYRDLAEKTGIPVKYLKNIDKIDASNIYLLQEDKRRQLALQRLRIQNSEVKRKDLVKDAFLANTKLGKLNIISRYKQM